jgi:uncharacterized protein (TIGR00297 family)
VRSWLSPAGVAAAALVGAAVTLAAGPRALAVLFVFFISASALTRGGGRRKPVQVFANGGLAALAAVLSLLDRGWLLAFSGALAAAAADTRSTEIGARSAAAPRLITNGRPVPRGTSGGVTCMGTLGGAAGAVLIGLSAVLLALATPTEGAWIAAAGMAGAMADSLLGAAAQARFHCSTCGRVAEARRCACGGPTALHSGLRWLDNDGVNFACTLAGALVASIPVLL